MAGRKHPFIPKFHSEDEEREFWEQVDLAKFIECPADGVIINTWNIQDLEVMGDVIAQI